MIPKEVIIHWTKKQHVVFKLISEPTSETLKKVKKECSRDIYYKVYFNEHLFDISDCHNLIIDSLDLEITYYF